MDVQQRGPRVALVTDSRDPSGMGEHMLLLADGAPFDLTFAAPPGRLLERVRALGHRVKAFGQGEDVRRWFQRCRFDAVHVHAGIGWEGLDLVHDAADAGSPVIRTEHLPYLLTDPAEVAAHRAAVDRCARLILVSDGVADSYAAAGIAGGQVTVIANGIDPRPAPRGRAAMRRELHLRDAWTVLHVGRFTPQKNQLGLIEAVASLVARGEDVQLLLVGTGDGEAAVRRRVATDLAGHVRLLGRREDVGDLLAAADVVALPSTFEGLPLTAIEAMAAGVPIVATRVAGITNLLDDQQAWLVDVGDKAALADALIAPRADRADADCRVAAARMRYDAYHRADAMRSRTWSVIEDSLGERHDMQHTRIGFIGAGGIAHRHIGVLEGMDDVRIAAVTDVDESRAREVGDRFGARVFASADELCASGEVDAVFICVPPFAHGAPERAAIAASLPMFVEKPVAIDLTLARELEAAIAAKGLVTAVGYHWRYLETLDDVARELGGRKPRLASGYWLDSTPPPRWWWRREQSGGQMVEQATHLVDLARYMMGDVVRVFGLAEHSRRDGFDELDVPTASTASLLFADGAVANFAATCLLNWNHRVGLHLFGEGFAVELTDRDVMIDTGHGRPVTPNRSDPVWREDRDFIDTVRGGENRIRCPYSEAVATLVLVDAIERSVAEGRAIDLDHARQAARREAA